MNAYRSQKRGCDWKSAQAVVYENPFGSGKIILYTVATKQDRTFENTVSRN